VVPAVITVMNTADSGPASLRAAITQADLDTTPDTIKFAASVTGTITLSSVLPALSAAITLDGPGASVLTVARSAASATPDFRIFTVPKGADVTISGLTISNGAVTEAGGGISNSGTLTVINSTLSGNMAGSGGGIVIPGNTGYSGSGGGIFNAGTLTVTDSTLSGNSAVESGFGGGISNSGTLTVTDSTLSGNYAVDGGGISNSGALTVTDSTLSGNSGGYGGGINNSGTLTVTDSTLSGNSAGGGVGGGIDNYSGTLTVTATIFANPKGDGGNISEESGGKFVSHGHNLFTDSPKVALAPTDMVNTNPLLGPLANNGGPTQTMALLQGSPAIGAGVVVAGVTTDQRGVPRPLGIAPAIGAYQSTFTVVSLQRTGTGYQPTHLVLTFNVPMNAATVQDLRNYVLYPVGPKGYAGPHPQPIPIVSAVYNTATRTVTLTTRSRLKLSGYYLLTVSGLGAHPVVDVNGDRLTGTGTGGRPGDYIAVVHGYGPWHPATPAAQVVKAKAVPAGPRSQAFLAARH
jgi:hypothetical protein